MKPAHSRLRVMLRVLLDAQGGEISNTFRELDILFLCWRASPKQFGIPGHPEHPDTNAFRSFMLGEIGAVKKGYLERVGPGRYRLTYEGMKLAEGKS